MEIERHKKKSIWEESYPIRFYEVGADKKLTVPNLCNFIQNSSADHINHLGVGLADLQRDNNTWVLSRMLLHINALPSWSDLVKLQTWQVCRHKLFAVRDYQISGADGQPVANATSSWLVLNRERRRPVCCKGYMEKMAPVAERRAISSFAEKVKDLAEEAVQITSPVQVSPSDIDMNGHVNNVKYLQWILENMSRAGVSSSHSMEIEVNYMGESFLGDSLLVKSSHCESQKSWLHSLVHAETDLEVCRASVNIKVN